MRIKDNDLIVDEYRVEYGHLASESFRSDITASALLFIYLSAAAIMKQGKWQFCISSKDLSEDLDLSLQYVNRSLKDLQDRGLIVKTEKSKGRSSVYIIPRPYQARVDYAIPVILAVTKVIPLSVKLFILKLQVSMPANRNEVLIFKSKSAMRKIVDNYTTLSNNLDILEGMGLMTQEDDSSYLIDLGRVYRHLHHAHIQAAVRKRNMV